MNLDIKTGLQTAIFLALLGVVISFYLGIRFIRTGRKLQFFRKRRERIIQGWRLIFISGGLVLSVIILGRYTEPIVYRVFPPSPTITLSPTITITPTITTTPSITLSPTITETPSVTYTPTLAAEVMNLFTSLVTPDPNSVFSQMQFARQIMDIQPVNPSTEMINPITKLFGTFSYNQMLVGSQWTALWIRLEDHKIMCTETKPWDGSTGGYGYTECAPPPDQWLPGEYEVQIYVGETWKVSSRFVVTGKPPLPSATPIPSRTPTLTRTSTATSTITPTFTETKTITTSPTITATFTTTPKHTETRRSTSMPIATRTPNSTP